MQVAAFSSPGTWLKGNIHTHSTRSDGALSPEEVVEAYRVRGYDFLSVTDHFLPNSHFRKGEEGFISITDTRDLGDGHMVTILGAELHGPAMENSEIWHFVAAGLPLDFEHLAPGESGVDVARRAVEAGAYVALAHPYWNGVSEQDATTAAEFVHGVEIYNHASEVGVKRGFGEHMTELLFARGNRLSVYAADDAHFKHPQGTFRDAFGGWVMVKAAEHTPEAIVTALKAGNCYATCGPEFLDVTLTDTALHIRCTPVQGIVVSGKGATFRRSWGDSLVEFEAPLPPAGKTPYLRITLIDAHGKCAWSNPIWLDDETR